MMRCIVLPDVESVEDEATRRLVAGIGKAQAQHGRCALALAGGSTPRGVYRRLAAWPGVDWQRVLVFWGDERAVPPDSPDSNQRLAREALLDQVPIPPSQVHPMPAGSPDLDSAARQYEDLLCSLLGRPPRLDLVLLGLGEDAHTASLFPGSAAAAERARFVVATPAPVIASRLTLTIPALAAADSLLFVVHGASKAWALRQVLHAASDPLRVPAHALRDAAVTFVVDRAAAGDRSAHGSPS
jgi:6-phosphogluconolactonase